MREYAQETLLFLQTLHEDIIYWYMGGWSIIFAATFGMKSAIQMMLPGKVATIASAYNELPDDVPEQVAEEAATRVRGLIDRVFNRRGDDTPTDK